MLFSFKKINNAQAQGGQSRGGLPTVNSTDLSNAPNPRGVQNGESQQIQSLGIVALFCYLVIISLILKGFWEVSSF